MPEHALAAARHAAELFTAIRSAAGVAPQCRLSLEQYHAVATSVLAADPDRQASLPCLQDFMVSQCVLTRFYQLLAP